MYARILKPSGFNSTPLCDMSIFDSLTDAKSTYKKGYNVISIINSMNSVLNTPNIFSPFVFFTSIILPFRTRSYHKLLSLTILLTLLAVTSKITFISELNKPIAVV